MDREASSGTRLSRVDILGVAVSAINLDMAVGAFEAWIRDEARQYVCVTGVHGVMESQSDPELLRIHNESGMTTPDGMPLVWCGRYAGASWMERVYGPDLMLRVCAESVDQGWSHFFYGAGPGVAEELAVALSERFPGLIVAGVHTPPFRELTEEEVLEVAGDDQWGAPGHRVGGTLHPQAGEVDGPIQATLGCAGARRCRRSVRYPRRAAVTGSPMDAAFGTGVVLPACHGAKQTLAALFEGNPTLRAQDPHPSSRIDSRRQALAAAKCGPETCQSGDSGGE